ncbi:hypothetical protein ES150_19865 [Enterobacillus tribolii]|uniref:putative zinc ribbon protein n=1 Tax=Enterobacillus tribolii TaxID=1487935 RepID=UPI000E1CAB25|nr:putative zinc ribbon protein [Enterobacillus tribolii]MBW7984798.1 hypothetical protein [Enterobacillus tribolii]
MLNDRNQDVNAKEAAEASYITGHWTCASCGCELLLRKGEVGSPCVVPPEFSLIVVPQILRSFI